MKTRRSGCRCVDVFWGETHGQFVVMRRRPWVGNTATAFTSVCFMSTSGDQAGLLVFIVHLGHHVKEIIILLRSYVHAVLFYMHPYTGSINTHDQNKDGNLSRLDYQHKPSMLCTARRCYELPSHRA